MLYARDIPAIWDALDEFFYSFPEPITRLPHFTEEVKDDVCVLSIDLPGVKQADLKVTQEENVVRVKGMRGKKEFDYQYRIPRVLDPGSLKASLSDGVLTLRMEKLAGSKVRVIELQ